MWQIDIDETAPSSTTLAENHEPKTYVTKFLDRIFEARISLSCSIPSVEWRNIILKPAMPLAFRATCKRSVSETLVHRSLAIIPQLQDLWI